MCEKLSNTDTSEGLGVKIRRAENRKNQFAGTSPEDRFRSRVDDIDISGSRVYRIDVF